MRFNLTKTASQANADFSSNWQWQKSDLESNAGFSPIQTPFSMKRCLMALLFSLSLFGANGLLIAQKTTIASGSWSNPAIWSPSGVPTTGQNVIIAAGHAVTLSANTNIGAGSLTVNGTLNRGTRGFTAGSLIGAASGVITGTGGILQVGSNNASTSYAGKLSGTFLTGSPIRKTGTGTLTLAGQSDYVASNSLAATVIGGTLRLGVTNALPAGSVFTVTNGGTFDLNGFNQTLSALVSASSSSSTATPVATNSAPTPVTFTINMPSGDGGYTYEGILSGQINLVVNGSDISNNWYWLSGTGITFTGNTSVTGTATLGLGTSLNGDLSVAAGSFLALTANSSCNTLTLGGVLQSAGTHGNTASSATFKNNAYFESSEPSFANVLTVVNGASGNCWGNGIQPFYPGVQPGAIPVVTSDPLASSTTVESRARWGGSGFEAALFTPANPGPPPAGPGLNMNPAGAPIWNDGSARNFSFTYNSLTGTSVWSVDWNKNLSFGSGESVSSTSPGLANKGFDYLSIFVQGSTLTDPASGASVTIQNFTINGSGFGTYSSSNSTATIVNFRNGAGYFGDITITGKITITGGAGTASERPRFYIKLGNPFELPTTTCGTTYSFNNETCTWDLTATGGILPFYPGVQPNAIPVVTTDPLASTTTVQARSRWGGTGFEAVLFTPANPGPPPAGPGLNMNPAGAPVWSDGSARNFSLTYNSSTGTSVWSIDWDKDLSFGSGESVSSTSPGLANKGFDYLSIFVQGSTLADPATGASISVDDFNINGTGFGTYSSSNSTATTVNFRNGAGYFGDITITGTITITGGAGTASERPRFYIRLGKPVNLLPAGCWDFYTFNAQTCKWETTEPGCSVAAPRLAFDQNIASAQEFVVFPNPSSGSYFISVPVEYGQETMTLQVWNATGQLISSRTVQATGTEMISLEDQPQGIYLLNVQTAGVLKTFRLVKN
jgi:hypothetical protein